ncbi:MAG: cell division protein FtsA [Rhizobiaceae bacterium]|nr:cell division protein FtsA [Rhizobiaceae bacterium]
MSLLSRDGFLPRMKPLPAKRSVIVSVLDIGTSKICCLIAKLDPREDGLVLAGRSHTIEILGIGHQRSRGIKSGVIVDLDAAEQAIRHAVDGAERMAGIMVESLIMNVSSGRLVSETFSADISLDGYAVEDKDIAQVLRVGAEHALAPERSVVHSLPIGYSLDGDHGIIQPRGMMGQRLGVDMHVVTAENAPLRNLELCINRAHLSVEAMVATPYAAGLAALVEDEAQMGCACIDIGGGTTTLSIFMDGRFVYADAIGIGGNHVTMDLARGLSTRLDDAEKLKVLHGSVLNGTEDANAMVSIPQVAEDDQDIPTQVPLSHLNRIIRPRVEETLEMIRDRLAKSGFADAVGKRLVLTGGGSQLNGLAEMARRVLSRNVRLGRPLGISGMPPAAKGPAFSTAVGLLIYPQIAQYENFSGHRSRSRSLMSGQSGPFSRFGNWLKESF